MGAWYLQEEERQWEREQGREEGREEVISALMSNLKITREKALALIKGSQTSQVQRMDLGQ